LNIDNKEIKEIQLFDLTGKLIRSFNSSPKIDLSNFSKGIYIIMLNSDKSSSTKN